MKHADLLQRALDGDPHDDPAPREEVAEDLGRLTALARALGDAGVEAGAATSRMPDDARVALRMQLIAQAQSRIAEPPSLRQRVVERIARTREGLAYNARLAGVSGVAAAMLSGGGVAVAADAALPGDLLHGLKMAVEGVVEGFHAEGTSRAAATLERATERVEEGARALGRDNDAAAALAFSMADDLARDGAQQYLAAYLDGGDTDVLAELGDWVVVTNRRLDLLPTPGGDAIAEIADLRVTLNRIGQRIEVLATGACTSCALGVHDDAGAQPDVARGAEADGTPPLPPAPSDLTVIPPAEQAFRACPCVEPTTPSAVGAPAPRSAPDPAPASPPDSGASPPEGRRPSGGGGGQGGGGGASPRPLPLPEVGGPAAPVVDPVRERVEEVIQSLPDPGVDTP